MPKKLFLEASKLSSIVEKASGLPQRNPAPRKLSPFVARETSKKRLPFQSLLKGFLQEVPQKYIKKSYKDLHILKSKSLVCIYTSVKFATNIKILCINVVGYVLFVWYVFKASRMLSDVDVVTLSS